MALLARARGYGFIGGEDLLAHVSHALGFVRVAQGLGRVGERVVDLGSGGGLPGLVVALQWQESHVTLIEAHSRRSAFLLSSVAELGWSERVVVRNERAEAAGRQASLRSTFDLATARGFGKPSPTAECAGPLLRPGGALIVSEPPDEQPGRWPADPLEQLGMRPGPRLRHGAAFQVVEQVALCPDRFPRRTGVPVKRPLFTGT